jgi:hypothetical protein
MHKDVPNPRSNPQFEDADYQIDLRLDPLTTSYAIKQELSDIEKSRKDREIAMLEEQKEKDSKEMEEFRAWKAQQAATEARPDLNDTNDKA